ncbi:Leucyl aminopeptidase (aminopeptidase T) [Butyrivibrio fibrisolvens DSM 3071]|uniref:Leucyl aminopeptidase (Aminopeptidase T) n=1 Tax=Butyrivibrio fibrisolvens DSM 3071 TaxID=1121131 RepID=A0A1M5QEV9_BUTFI|nr:aminopeptidase [Butyrivibrio fibrisolvens]SHH12083.1 Leucyl aminopeptidase (aminopeptidase T) [Butyrivibrio fibrisolvens DSM 3071]
MINTLNTQDLNERLAKVKAEIAAIFTSEKEDSFFAQAAKLVSLQFETYDKLADGSFYELDADAMQAGNDALYSWKLESNYENSFVNPAKAVAEFGDKGQIIAFLADKLVFGNTHIFNNRKERFVVALELFLEIYNLYKNGADVEEWKKAVSKHQTEVIDMVANEAIHRQYDPDNQKVMDILDHVKPGDYRFLYLYGLPVSENEVRTAKFIDSLSEEELTAMAGTLTKGYRKGFEVMGVDFSKKTSACFYYNVGFEKMVKTAVAQFKEMGLASTFIVDSGAENKQSDFDHKQDMALYLDEAYLEKYLSAFRKAYESIKDKVRSHGGPAAIEIFGERDFEPVSKKEALAYNEQQRPLFASLVNKSALLRTEFLPGEERSFAIIAYPVPEIGDKFEQIFADTVKINTLPREKYQKIQQALIDALDLGDHAVIKGMNGNKTDITVSFHELKNPEKETNFENCLDDVNIPLGEVFTSPVLNGTNGLLHVKEVFINGLKYTDLSFTVKDGMVTDFSCNNFENPADGRKLVDDEIMRNHETLAMGEFAIGTNTVAYVMGIKHDIQAKLPILIAEKTGPHFAFGDTCYSHSEDHAVFNPDGKEIIARENEVSALRNEDPEKAYFGCHTDITVPYNELGEITVYGKDGYEKTIIKDGRFVLEGTEFLNEALEELN